MEYPAYPRYVKILQNGEKQNMPSDINLSQLIFSKTPEKWHPYIKITRIDRPIGIWLLLLPCWWGIILAKGLAEVSFKEIALFGIGAVLMRAAGCIINDLWDRKLDSSVDRTKDRPLASGEISMLHALRFLVVLLALSLLVLMQLPRLTILLGIVSIALVIAYPYMKRITWLPQLFLGFTFNWGVLMGWSAVTEELSLPALYLYIGGIFWTLGYDTIYAHQDKEDDIRIGVKSTARLLGDKSRAFVAGCYGLAVMFILIAKYDVSPNVLTALLSAPMMAQMVWQLRSWDINDPQSCLRVFRSNQYFGWLVLLMLAV
jgi:4-hydroxybenzoate polyprenyltransferase